MSNQNPTPEQQPRIPGVKYAKEVRFRQETTTIDGVPSTRNVPYDVLVPVPPRDWDEVILRGVTGLAMGITGLAVVGTTASVGGQLSTILHPVIAYGTGVVFTSAWLAAMGLEWVMRTDPKRANPARIVGWIALAISMAAVFSYGHAHGQDLAGGVGACLDLLAKGLWALLIHTHRVPLSAGVQGWLIDQEGTAAGRALLARKIARLNRNEAYQRAVGGREYQAAGAILTIEEPVQALTAPVVIAESVPVVPVAPEVPPVPPVQPLSGQTGQAPAPIAPQAPVPPVFGQTAGQVSALLTGGGQAPVPQMSGQGAPVSGQTSGQQAPQGSHPNVTLFGPSRAATIRNALADNEQISDEDLIDLVKAAHGDSKNLADNVRRERSRILNPPKSRKKTS